MLNQATLVGHLGANPEIRQVNDNRKVANFSIATNYRYTDNATGEVVERTDWHRIVVWHVGLIETLEKGLLVKGSHVLVQGEIRTRKYEQEGVTKYSTEIVLSGPKAYVEVLSPRPEGAAPYGSKATPPTQEQVLAQKAVKEVKELQQIPASDDIPF